MQAGNCFLMLCIVSLVQLTRTSALHTNPSPSQTKQNTLLLNNNNAGAWFLKLSRQRCTFKKRLEMSSVNTVLISGTNPPKKLEQSPHLQFSDHAPDDHTLPPSLSNIPPTTAIHHAAQFNHSGRCQTTTCPQSPTLCFNAHTEGEQSLAPCCRQL